MQRALIAFGCFWITCHGALDLPYARPMPDQPVPVPHKRSTPVMAGTRSFQPVDPLPWVEENRNAAPKPESMPSMPGMQHDRGQR